MFTPPKPTMDIIAILACVSRAAVSYYFWGSHRNLSPATRQRIREVAIDIGYAPYENDEWFESHGKHILLQKGYDDPYQVREELRLRLEVC